MEPALDNLRQEQLARLPLRRLVALLARNARRVQPLLGRGPAEDLQPGNLQAIEAAIRSAEAFAGGADQSEDDGSSAFAVAMRCSATSAPIAFAAALAACCADHAAGVGLYSEAGSEALATAAQALDYYLSALPEGTNHAQAFGDLEALLAMGGPGFPNLGSAIDPSEQGPLGPLWGTGKPPSDISLAMPGWAAASTSHG
jgi:hypothetical protein